MLHCDSYQFGEAGRAVAVCVPHESDLSAAVCDASGSGLFDVRDGQLGAAVSGGCSLFHVRSDGSSRRITGSGAVPKTFRATLTEGDGVLLCTGGLGDYLFETEVALDLQKSATVRDWRDYLLVRLVGKTHLMGGTFAMISGIWSGREDGL